MQNQNYMSASMAKIKTNKIRRLSFLRLGVLSIIFFVAVYILYISLGAGYSFVKTRFTNGTTDVNSEKVYSRSVADKINNEKDLILYISRHIKLPDENPTVYAKVKDAQKLEGQSPFYADVKEGQYVLIYPSLAIIYDAERDVLIKTMSIK